MDRASIATPPTGPGDLRYLGHHWSHKRETGEQNITLNYTRALSDFITNFCFGKGVEFKSAPQYSAILPRFLDEVWTQDNPKELTLWEMGQSGGVSGDCFVKVAYEEAFVDPAGIPHEGKIRIIPLNAAHSFPEFHPHDRTRMLRFKLKYRFWATSLEGTRSVYTFTELITDDTIEQYVNDELVDSYPNFLGTIPIVHIPNTTILSSPWGQSDIQDIIPLNRELNEKMTEVSDIINYHAAPVTIITGAKASQLERGPKKVWAGLPKDANVFNLESKGEMSSAIEYVTLIKRAMHEMTGVPETALGQVQPISNTSGVALAITYQPLMNRYSLKKITFTLGLQRINALVIRSAAIFAPNRLVYDPTTSAPLEEGQAQVVDISDPKATITDIYWPPPLPVDLLVKLNEVQTKMALGLESKQGALADLGEQFPQEKLLEIFDQMKQDALDQGALDMLRAQISQAVMMMTGFVPESDGSPSVADSSTSDVASGTSGPPQTGPLPGTAIDPALEEDLMNQLVQKAYGTKFAQRRVPET